MRLMTAGPGGYLAPVGRGGLGDTVLQEYAQTGIGQDGEKLRC